MQTNNTTRGIGGTQLIFFFPFIECIVAARLKPHLEYSCEAVIVVKQCYNGRVMSAEMPIRTVPRHRTRD